MICGDVEHCLTGICGEVRLILDLVTAIRRAWAAKRSRGRKYSVASMPLHLEDLYRNTYSPWRRSTLGSTLGSTLEMSRIHSGGFPLETSSSCCKGGDGST